MAEVVMPSQASPGIRSTVVDESCDIDGNGSPFSLNQAFAFPPQQPLSSPSALIQSVSSTPQAMPHRSRPGNLSLASLPAFDFGVPASPSSLRPNPSPTRSPIRLTPPTHMGHKRAGSEFVGGDLTGGGPVLVPTAAIEDARPPSAPSSPARGPPSSWRGHAHRRSHAVSQSDIRSMMQPPLPVTSGSLPVTPLEDATKNLSIAPQRSMSHDPTPLQSQPKSNLSSGPSFTPSRPRVEFSDTPEFIPRPLSTISSDTSSSMSTVRMSHSLSESVSSLHAAGTCSPPALRTTSLPVDSRASASHHNATLSNSNPSSEALQEPPRSTPIDVHTEQRGFDHEALPWPAPSGGSESSQVKSFDFEAAGRSFAASKPHTSGEGPDECPSPHTNLTQSSPAIRPKTSPDPNSSHSSPRVNSWADNFLHRKGRRDAGAVRRSGSAEQSPLAIEVQEPQFSLEDISFDNDTTMIIEEPSVSAVPSNRSSVPQPERADPPSEFAISSPIIDIDLAMSFPGFPDDGSGEHLVRAGGQKRRLHSSGETGGFSGPGMHYHRRTESAPEMDAFEGSRFGFPRFGSNPAMEEAIVEEDEELDPESTQDDSHVLGLGVNIVDEDLDVNNPQQSRKPRSHNGSRRIIRRIMTPPDTLQVQPVQIIDVEEEPRFSMVTKSSDESSITPTVSPDPLGPRPVSAPLDFAIKTPSLAYGTTPETRSNVSSADYRQTSFEFREPHLHTARSSLTDRMTLSSSKAGNMSAASSEDVPSLTGSASTVMSGLQPRASSYRQGCEQAARPASFSVPDSSKARSEKRGSLASLSKLMSGPYSKSKLNIAETLRPDSPAPEKAYRRKSRISRMMKFWKSKESLTTR